MVKYLLFILLSFPLFLGAQENNNRTEVLNNDLGFIENKGQIIDQDGRPRNDVKFVLNGLSYKTILRDNGFSYEWYNAAASIEDHSGNSQPNTKFLSQRIDIQFGNIITQPTITAESQQSFALNYFLNGKNTTAVHSFKKVRYSNVYPGIDVLFSVNSGELKYDFIIAEGADASQIELIYEGLNQLEEKSGVLLLLTDRGTIKEYIPESYLQDPGSENRTNINIRFVAKANHLTYEIPDYDHAKKLTIDPGVSRVWGTFFGGSKYDEITNIRIDSLQRIIFCGWSTSTSNIATVGAYQYIIAGSLDAVIGRFNQNGILDWATYFGGTDQEKSFDLALDQDENIFLSGFTRSLSGIATPGAYQTTFGGGVEDVFLAKFDSLGFRQWCTYYGGNGDDEANAVDVNNSGHICIAGFTKSSSGIATPGAFQTTYMAGYNDGFIALYDSTGTLQWSTYYGGNSTDEIHDVDLNDSGQVTFAAYIRSPGLASPGAYQTTYAGSSKGMFGVFDINGVRIWSTYFGGASGESLLACAFDSQNNIIASGSTGSLTGIASPGAFQPNKIGGSDGLIIKFTNGGQRIWSTYFGGDAGESFSGIYIDSNDNIYLTGSSNSSTGLSSPGAFQATGNPASADNDAVIALFTPGGSRIWATYLGDSENDYGKSIVVDSSGFVYFAGQTLSQTYLGTPGTHQPGPGSNTTWFDGYLEKFDQPVILTGPIINPFCAGSTINISFNAIGNFGPTQTFEALLSDSLGSFLNDTVIGTITGVTTGTITATIPLNTSGGNFYRIAVRSVDRNIFDQDNGSNITIWPIPVVSFLLPFDFCLYAHWTPLDSVSPGGQPIGGTFSGPGVDTAFVFTASTAGVGTHNICYTYSEPHGCSTQTACWPVVVYAPLNATFSSVPSVCENASLFPLTQGAPTGPGIGVYGGPGVDASGNFNPTSVSPGTYQLYYIYFDAGGCLPDTAYQTITVFSPPPPVITWNGSVLSSNTAISYQWYLNNNIISGGTSQTFIPLINGSYFVIVNQGGCLDTSNIIVITNVGIEQVKGFSVFEINPNPSEGLFEIHIKASYAFDCHLEIVDATGKVVLAKYYSSNDEIIDKIDLTPFGSGIYLVRIEDDNKVASVKLIVE